MKKRPKGFSKLDIAELLTSKEEIKRFLEEAAQEEDAEHFAYAVGIAMRAYGMQKVADKTGLNRGNLYRTFRKGGNPGYITMSRVLEAMGVTIKIA